MIREVPRHLVDDALPVEAVVALEQVVYVEEKWLLTQAALLGATQHYALGSAQSRLRFKTLDLHGNCAKLILEMLYSP